MFKLLAVIWNVVNGQPVLATHYDGVMTFPTLAACEMYISDNKEELDRQLFLAVQDDDAVLDGYTDEISCQEIKPENQAWDELGDTLARMRGAGFPGSALNPLHSR